jgi:hypothetical protein
MPDAAPPAKARRDPILCIGGILVVLELAAMYVCAGWAKHTSPEWLDGTALDLTMRWDEFARPATSGLLLHFPRLLRFMTYAVMAMEIAGPLLFLGPWGRRRPLMRTIGIVLFAGLHLGIDATLHIELFCYYPIAGLAALLPAEAWDRVLAVPRVRRAATWLRARLPGIPALGTARPVRAARRVRSTPGAFALRAAWVAGVGFAVISFYSSFPLVDARLPYPQWMVEVNEAFFGMQNWNTFVHPPKSSGWHRAKAHLADGSVVDLLQDGATFSEDKPADPSAVYKNRRWRKFYLQAHANWQTWPALRQQIAKVLVDQWDRAHPQDKQVAQIEVSYIMEEYEPFEPVNHPVRIVKSWNLWSYGQAVASAK